MRRKNRMNKSEKRAQTFLYMGVLLTLIAADWHWYLGEFPEESFVAGLPVMVFPFSSVFFN